MSNWYFDSNYI